MIHRCLLSLYHVCLHPPLCLWKRKERTRQRQEEGRPEANQPPPEVSVIGEQALI